MPISMIKKAQSLGFTLSEIKGIVLKKSASNEFPVHMACSIIDEKRTELEKEIGRLTLLGQRLSELKDELVSTFK